MEDSQPTETLFLEQNSQHEMWPPRNPPFQKRPVKASSDGPLLARPPIANHAAASSAAIRAPHVFPSTINVPSTYPATTTTTSSYTSTATPTHTGGTPLPSQKYSMSQLSSSAKIAKPSEEADKELDQAARRSYIAHLSNLDYDEPVQMVFPGMKRTHPSYIRAFKKVKSVYKTWKNRVLMAAQVWVKDYIDDHPEYASLDTFKELKEVVRNDYEIHWLPSVFRFAVEAVDFDKCSKIGLEFLRCKLIFRLYIVVLIVV